MDENMKKQLDEFYRELEFRQIRIAYALNHRMFSLTLEYRTCHTCFSPREERVTSEYPLPWIEIQKLCEIQIEPDCVSLFTKLRKENCGVLESGEFAALSFDIWGEDDHYTLMYRSGKSGASVYEALANKDERAFIVHFRIPNGEAETAIYPMAKLLFKRGFFL